VRRWQHRADRSSQPWPVGHEVEGEQRDRERLEHDVEQRRPERQQTRRGALRDVPGCAALDELLSELVGIDLDAEVVLQPRLGLIDVAGSLVDEGVDLAGQHAAHGETEPGHRRDDGEEDESGREPAPHAGAIESVHRRFDGEGQEQRHEQHHQQGAQRVQHATTDPQHGGAGPEQDDGAHDPARHPGRIRRLVVCRRPRIGHHPNLPTVSNCAGDPVRPRAQRGRRRPGAAVAGSSGQSCLG
jgi:hypothetical protein